MTTMQIEDFDFSVNLLEALTWQRNNAVNLQGLAQQKQDWYNTNQTEFWNDWIANVFNLQTANYFGLSVWCIILQVPYFIQNTPPLSKPIWGFNQQPPINNNVNFQNGNFTSTNYPEFTLSVDDQRIVCQLRYFQLITRGAVQEINTFLNFIFNNPMGPYQGGAWVVDNFDMTMTYTFNCGISVALFNVLVLYDILPRPAGVGLKYLPIAPNLFGFNETPPINHFMNFDNGNFTPEFYPVYP